MKKTNSLFQIEGEGGPSNFKGTTTHFYKFGTENGGGAVLILMTAPPLLPKIENNRGGSCRPSTLGSSPPLFIKMSKHEMLQI